MTNPVPLRFLDPINPLFPHPETALREPNGLLAAGGNLSVDTLRTAYRQGIFPWYTEGQPLLWWSPDPRAVIYADRLHVSRSLRKILMRKHYEIRVDFAFEEVLKNCAQPRSGRTETWITRAMHQAYMDMYAAGHAHCVECWIDGTLAGGLYGIASGSVFSGESMFSNRANASKIVMAHLVAGIRQAGFTLLDCQITSPHLTSLGATELARAEFIRVLHSTAERELDWPKSLISDKVY